MLQVPETRHVGGVCNIPACLRCAETHPAESCQANTLNCRNCNVNHDASPKKLFTNKEGVEYFKAHCEGRIITEDSGCDLNDHVPASGARSRKNKMLFCLQCVPLRPHHNHRHQQVGSISMTRRTVALRSCDVTGPAIPQAHGAAASLTAKLYFCNR